MSDFIITVEDIHLIGSFDQGIITFVTTWWPNLGSRNCLLFAKERQAMKLSFQERKLSWSSGHLELGKQQEFPQTTPKCLSNVQECWIVLDLLQRLPKPVPITVNFFGLFCSVDTCRPWNGTRSQLLSHRSPCSQKLVTTVTHYLLKM